jgi:hypothetical protein
LTISATDGARSQAAHAGLEAAPVTSSDGDLAFLPEACKRAADAGSEDHEGSGRVRLLFRQIRLSSVQAHVGTAVSNIVRPAAGS